MEMTEGSCSRCSDPPATSGRPIPSKVLIQIQLSHENDPRSDSDAVLMLLDEIERLKEERDAQRDEIVQLEFSLASRTHARASAGR